MSLTHAQQLIADESFDTDLQREQMEMLDEIHRQQIHLVQFGCCTFGCQEKFVGNYWSVQLASKLRSADAGGSTMQSCCKWTRQPCPSFRLRNLVDLYNNLNNDVQPLASMVR